MGVSIYIKFIVQKNIMRAPKNAKKFWIKGEGTWKEQNSKTPIILDHKRRGTVKMDRAILVFAYEMLKFIS